MGWKHLPRGFLLSQLGAYTAEVVVAVAIAVGTVKVVAMDDVMHGWQKWCGLVIEIESTLVDMF